jgi:hypothetical protein
MNILGAVLAGLGGTISISMVMALAPQMGMPAMDIVGMLGAMFSKESNRPLGWMIHLMMGVVFALIYALLWTIGIGTVSPTWGIVFGIVHWLLVGLMMGMMPMMHVGIKSGGAQRAPRAPGVFMLNNGGMMAFVGGLMGHAIYGVVVAVIYGLFV